MHGIITEIVIGLLGFAGNWFHLELFFNLDFLFGSFFVMLAILRGGPFSGLLAGLIAGSCTYFLWNHPWAIIIFTAEAAFVGILHRKTNREFVFLDIAFWILAGGPLVWIFYHHLMGMTFQATLLVFLKQSTNGIFNTLLAVLVHLLLQGRWGIQREYSSFRHILFASMVSLVLFPALVFLVMHIRNFIRHHEEELAYRSSRMIQATCSSLSRSINEHLQDVQTLRRLIGNPDATPRPMMQRYVELLRESSPQFVRMGVHDRNTILLAHAPLPPETGKNPLGRPFPGRDYLKIIESSGKPYISDLVTARVGKPEPVIHLLAPFVVDGSYRGYCVGVMSTPFLLKELKTIVGGDNSAITVIDRSGRVIVSTRTDLHPTDRFPQPTEGSARRFPNGASHRVPPEEPGISTMKRWRDSMVVQESALSTDLPWRVVIETPFAPLIDRLSNETNRCLAAMWVLILATVVLSQQVSKRLVEPLVTLQDVTREFPRRFLIHKPDEWPESRIRELNGLISNFRQMAHTLRTFFQELKSLNESLEEKVRSRVSELDRINQRLLESQTIARLGCCEIDLTDDVAFCSPEIFRIFELDESSPTPTPEALLLRIHPADREAIVGLYHDSVRSGEPFDVATRLLMSNGRIKHIRMRQIVYHDAARKPVRILGTFQDITARRQAEEALLSSEQLYRGLIRTSPDAITVVELNGTIKVANRKALAIYGHDSEEEVVGRNVLEWVSDAEIPRAESLFAEIVGGKSLEHEEIILRTSHGREFWGEVTAQRVSLGESGNDCIIIISSDISARKDVEGALHRAKEAAEAANVAKGQFLANMSHEIRTPMNAIIGFGNLALETDLTPRQQTYLTNIVTSAQTLLAVINDILDFSKIESGHMELESFDFPLDDVISPLRQLVAAWISTKDVKTLYSIAPDVPECLRGDPLRLNQILMNLMSNAVKFTNQGTIELSIDTEMDRNGRGEQLRCSVRDTGIGIDREHMAELFRPFCQADSSISRKHGGTGLGLSICKRLIDMMGGDIRIESSPGEGSTFTFTIPLVPGSITAGKTHSTLPKPPFPFQQKELLVELIDTRVLVVEDQSINQIYVRELLKKGGIKVTMAVNGADAIAKAKSEPHPFDLILMDIQMPELDGYSATRSIRQLPGYETVPVVAMTAHAMIEDQKRSAEAGMIAHLCKPFSERDLYGILIRLMHPRQTAHLNSAIIERRTVAGNDMKLPASLPGIDITRALQQWEGNTRIMAKALISFRKEKSGAAREIAAAIGKGDCDLAIRLAHGLKGVSSVIAADGLMESAERFESAIRKGDDSAVHQLLEELEESLQLVISSAETFTALWNGGEE